MDIKVVFADTHHLPRSFDKRYFPDAGDGLKTRCTQAQTDNLSPKNPRAVSNPPQNSYTFPGYKLCMVGIVMSYSKSAKDLPCCKHCYDHSNHNNQCCTIPSQQPRSQADEDGTCSNPTKIGNGNLDDFLFFDLAVQSPFGNVSSKQQQSQTNAT